MKVLVIGGGAAGMLCAYLSAKNGCEVTLAERNNSCGVKLNITGKGRCNITNDCDAETLMKSMACNGKFLYSAFSAFSAALRSSLYSASSKGSISSSG